MGFNVKFLIISTCLAPFFAIALVLTTSHLKREETKERLEMKMAAMRTCLLLPNTTDVFCESFIAKEMK